MPLTRKGARILASMKRPVSQGGYGAKEGEAVFYASRNKGAIKGVEKRNGARLLRGERRRVSR